MVLATYIWQEDERRTMNFYYSLVDSSMKETHPALLGNMATYREAEAGLRQLLRSNAEAEVGYLFVHRGSLAWQSAERLHAGEAAERFVLVRKIAADPASVERRRRAGTINLFSSRTIWDEPAAMEATVDMETVVLAKAS